MSTTDTDEAMRRDALGIQDAIDTMLDDYRNRWGDDPQILLQKHRKGKEVRNVIIVTVAK